MLQAKSKSKILFVSIGCTLFLCVVLYIGLRGSDSDSLGSEEMAGNGIDQQRGPESNQELAFRDSRNGNGRAPVPGPEIQKQRPSNPTNRSENIFADRPIVESWETQAVKFGWSYDDLANNVLLWKELCDSSEVNIASVASSYIDGSEEELFGKIESFCEGFSEWRASAGQEFKHVYNSEAIAGQTSYHSMLSELDGFGQANRLELVSQRLNRAIAQLNEAALLDLLSYLAFSDFGKNQLRGDQAEVSTRYGVSQIITASAILICEQIGGCGSTHLLTIRMCEQFRQRLCSNPENIYDAVYQQLTGLEWERLVEFLRQVDAVRLQGR